MTKSKLFLCEGSTLEQAPENYRNFDVLKLNIRGEDANVNIQMDDVCRTFYNTINPRLLDLVEIASYVFTADASTPRGEGWEKDASAEKWSRHFSFVIPVRDVEFWANEDISNSLCSLLNFLSNDEYSFKFIPSSDSEVEQLYINFADYDDWPLHARKVLLFSGGLDSLAGAVESAAKGENLVLVSHRSVSFLSKRQKELFNILKATFPNVKMLHIPVWINKDKSLGREHTQRTRSFLFFAIGVVIAESLHAEGLRFFENGVISLNFPVSEEVLQARASRTTHPITLSKLKDLGTKILGRDFTVDNPFILSHKTDIINKIKQYGAAKLIAYSCSCAHLGFDHASKTQHHCGGCSQCIDRRLAVIAAGLEEDDPETDYQIDVFTGPRKIGYERNIAVGMVRFINEIKNLSVSEFSTRFSLEISRAVRPLRSIGTPSFVATKLAEMLISYANLCHAALTDQVKKNASSFIDGDIDDTSLLGLIQQKKHTIPAWKEACMRIYSILNRGLRPLNREEQPKTEPHLQAQCQGLLMAANENLSREFPFLKWSVVMTKPDFYEEDTDLLIELKYVREKSDIKKIIRDIAEDITKYGDNGKNVLFIVYDPYRLIVDQAVVGKDVERRDNMILYVI